MAHRLTPGPAPRHPATGCANPSSKQGAPAQLPSRGISLPIPSLEKWTDGNLDWVWTGTCGRQLQGPLQGNGCFSDFNN